MSFDQLKLKNQLCHRLYMASNSIVRAYREPLSELNITYPQYVVMMALWEHDKITIAELLDKTMIDGGAMTQILKKMVDKRLLEIIKDDNDKRKRLVQLTQQGQELKIKAASIPNTISCKFTHINSTQASQLMELLDLVVNDLAIKT
ncbi:MULTISPECIES: MarR family winged helix-turn-helix transcriptional regulator [unclassified Colwellia]|jgi:DNA-binding MarR family transcriptional regulator|uniref:MarR family winged helix-turn-helix transcriptional regulator n=1 Tax=unclassified Colwellia TaxID=196834 RepID=UPI0015F63774|nr:MULTISPECIES: MarR family transcriptional regulator [unclassified Colwellia]MBA6365561.1 MarR family transcriptional regulator [Colwellia sp. BRX8-8]MBA6347168.1 MarR family transcriptional regulator [Colwellia sp. BRX8-9]MBA6357654.1 MarR family transcriptional regulator [Colwellia sp. BRX8-3]MBA6358592.1 MarR family transcriptional regulator [Colwellia sp. BRX8-6]MBA6366757.1 MarR family transcriptional regulator [Colwellia sp. BRX8-5]